MNKEPKENARSLAFGVLLDVFTKGAYANLALDKALFSCHLEQRDRNLATEVVYGTVKYKLHLEYQIDQLASKQTEKMDKKTYTILVMSLYQLEFLSKVPNHAIVYEAVELAKREKLNSTKFINAILRKKIEQGNYIIWPNKGKQKITYLSKFYSFPQWMLELWHKRFGYDNTVSLCEYFNAPAPLWIRTNLLKINRDSLQENLERIGIFSEKSLHAEEGLLLKNPGDLRQISFFQEGFFTVQDESSMLVAHALNPQRNDVILDMCAAPGGKTTHIASLLGNSGQVIACDLHEHRVDLINENVTQLGLKNVSTEVRDMTNVPAKWYEKFDRILLDAPCSGLGVLNRRADSRWHKRKSDIKELVDLQSKLLEQAIRCLKPGGLLIYSTCTLVEDENRKQVEAFLERHPETYLDEGLKNRLNNFHVVNGMCEILPFENKMDGFFIASIYKKEKV